MPISQQFSQNAIDKNTQGEMITIAVVLRPRGIKGEVSALSLTSFPERFKKLKSIWLQYPNGELSRSIIESTWFHNSFVIFKFSGIDSRSQAEQLAKCKIQIPMKDRVKLSKQDDEFFIDMLIGCKVELPDSSCLGQVVDISSMGGGDTLVVRSFPENSNTAKQEEYLIPFVQSICPNVDISKKLIKVTPPEGLFDIQRTKI